MSSNAPQIVVLNQAGLSRVLNGQVGMTFMVDHSTPSGDTGAWVVHVRDYRYRREADGQPQLWSIGPEGYDIPVGSSYPVERLQECVRRLHEECGMAQEPWSAQATSTLYVMRQLLGLPTGSPPPLLSTEEHMRCIETAYYAGTVVQVGGRAALIEHVVRQIHSPRLVTMQVTVRYTDSREQETVEHWQVRIQPTNGS